MNEQTEINTESVAAETQPILDTKAAEKGNRRERRAAAAKKRKAKAKTNGKNAKRKEKRSPAETLKAYRDAGAYIQTDGYAGLSINNGDDIALSLRMLEPKRVVAVAEAVLPGIKKGELVKKYDKLNPGMQRMNAGNRIRAAIKSKRITKTALKKAIRATK